MCSKPHSTVHTEVPCCVLHLSLLEFATFCVHLHLSLSICPLCIHAMLGDFWSKAYLYIHGALATKTCLGKATY